MKLSLKKNQAACHEFCQLKTEHKIPIEKRAKMDMGKRAAAATASAEEEEIAKC